MLSLIASSLRYYWRTHLGVLAGALLASAVLTGGLLVGDSVDYSLRTFASQRLGDVQYAVNLRSQYFHQDLASELQSRLPRLVRRMEHAGQATNKIATILQVRGMAIFQGDTNNDRKQINQVEVLGVEPGFWSFGRGEAPELSPNETVINEKLAAALGVKEGSKISLRVARPSLLARDAPLSARGEDRSWRTPPCTVKKVVPDSEMGRFSLSPSQVSPYNVFVSRSWLQERIELPGRVNLLLHDGGSSAKELETAVAAAWSPDHIGLAFRAHESGIVQLETDRIFLDPEAARAARTLPGGSGALTYVVNSLSKGDLSTPYPFVMAGPVHKDMADDQIVINRWLADLLKAGVGDRIALAYAELLPSNDFVDKSRNFTVQSVREMEGLRAERDLMPTFPGLSDANSCADWDVGVPMDRELLKDEAIGKYWKAYGQTPKAFVTLRAGQEMWANRFGDLTAVRYPGSEEDAARLREALKAEMDPSLAGLFFVPVGEQADAAVSQALDFGGLFLGISFFLIIAALMLTGLLFVFGVQQRASEMGALLALGYTPRRVRLLMLGEGFAIALAGSIAGVLASTGYTHALIYGLTRYWQGAVANAPILYHAENGALAMGGAISLLCAMCAVALAMWRQSKRPARELLSLDFTQEQTEAGGARFRTQGLVLSVAGAVLAVAVIAYALLAGVTAMMVPFLAAGSLLLLSGMGLCRHTLIVLNSHGGAEGFSLRRLALQNVARRRGRSLAVVALLACGCFMVFAVSSMQEDLRANARERSSGTGGFALVADSTFSLLKDPFESLGEPGISGTAIKVRDGDDASCLNLNRAQAPRILGVNASELASRGAFSKNEDGAFWDLLDLELPGGAIPALVGDSNTAMFNLMKKTGPDDGDVLLYTDAGGNKIRVKLVGALPMRLSVFQGSILISDKEFTRLFPSEDGHRMFLVDAPADAAEEAAAQLGRAYDRFGFDAVPAVDRLLEYYAVETTYLAMFLVLGGLGLAVGSAGMGVVVLRNLLERRGELAMLGALGFGRRPIHQILFTEYGILLAAGLGVGTLTAAVSVLPTILASESSVSLGVQLPLAFLVLVASASCMSLAILIGFRQGDADALRNE
jgi:ABC-type lipoprotein release transport system permease subunit